MRFGGQVQPTTLAFPETTSASSLCPDKLASKTITYPRVSPGPASPRGNGPSWLHCFHTTVQGYHEDPVMVQTLARCWPSTTTLVCSDAALRVKVRLEGVQMAILIDLWFSNSAHLNLRDSGCKMLLEVLGVWEGLPKTPC